MAQSRRSQQSDWPLGRKCLQWTRPSHFGFKSQKAIQPNLPPPVDILPLSAKVLSVTTLALANSQRVIRFLYHKPGDAFSVRQNKPSDVGLQKISACIVRQRFNFWQLIASILAGLGHSTVLKFLANGPPRVLPHLRIALIRDLHRPYIRESAAGRAKPGFSANGTSYKVEKPSRSSRPTQAHLPSDLN
jgi:hypothetical protein